MLNLVHQSQERILKGDDISPRLGESAMAPWGLGWGSESWRVSAHLPCLGVVCQVCKAVGSMAISPAFKCPNEHVFTCIYFPLNSILLES